MSESDWDTLVNAQMRLQKCSRGKAIESALASEGGRYLFQQQKRSEQVASGLFTALDMQMLDGANAELQAHGDLHKRANQYKSEFEHLVDDVMREKPHLSLSEAGDHVRSTPDGMKAWVKHKGKPGMNGPQQNALKPGHTRDDGSRLPYVPETSGRSDPPRTPQWQSDHSGSTSVTPARTPERMPERLSEAPAIKAWLNMVNRMASDTGFSRERAVDILKLLPEGRRALERATAEAASL